MGIEGFFCIVRSTPDYHISPQWYFMTEALSDYMKIAVRRKWDTHEVGTKLEVFAIAGCDPISMCSISGCLLQRQLIPHRPSQHVEKEG